MRSVQPLKLRGPDGRLTVLGAALLGVLLGAAFMAALYTVIWAVTQPPGGADTEWVDLPDGRSVLCVVDGTGYDCDWAGAALEGDG